MSPRHMIYCDIKLRKYHTIGALFCCLVLCLAPPLPPTENTQHYENKSTLHKYETKQTSFFLLSIFFDLTMSIFGMIS